MLRVAILVSGGGTNLEAILKAKDEGKLPNASIELVVSNKKNAFALERAKKHGVRAIYLKNTEFEENLVNIITGESIDLIVLAGFLKILSKEFVQNFENRIINVHPSLIPSFCGKGYYGLTVHERALERGVKLTGATVHYVNEVPDGGKIILQKAVEVMDGDTPEILQKRVMEEAEWQILPKAIDLISKEQKNTCKM
ncbi:MAG: phosphoribosylglycinamide formyltransferase [Sphaerochaetaceae bacterium]|nr:phosphoribosylglycinamide formyltransferase [Sphaerochaetaceae bacterium]